MKKLLLLLTASLFLACSGDDNNDPINVDTNSYSAHMKNECPSDSETIISDYCITKPVYDYLEELRMNTTPTNSCLWVEFETPNGEIIEGYLIRVELNQVDCSLP